MKTLKEEIKHLELKEIIPDDNQPRKYFDPAKMKFLKDSINKYGIMNPITVEKIGDKYLLVDGERRFRAATELKLDEVPCIVMAPQSAVDRLIQQFHVQEQHEGWTATEKAVVVEQLSKELKLSIPKLAEMLGLDDTVTQRYLAYSNLIEKKEFQKSEISIQWASPIIQVRKLAKSVYEDKMEKVFSQDMERKIERSIINQIKDGDLKRPNELTKLKDSFTRSPKDIETFIKTDVTVSELFIQTKAKSAFHLRNIVNSSGYVAGHVARYLEKADVIPTEKQIIAIKQAHRALGDFIQRVDK